jgi:diguanylate cyclase (GGDEF)-like protein
VDDLDDQTVVGITADSVGELSRDRAYLIVISGVQVGEMISLGDNTVLGRGADVDVRLHEDKLSRRHCRFFVEDGASYVEDLKSSNGTFVNGARIERQKLNDGDKIQIGETTILKFTYHDRLEEDFQKQMYESALRDGLTKAYNKKYFLDRIRVELAFTGRHKSPLSLILFDIDHFKKINDTHGHLAGDKVLVALAQHVSRLLRAEDVFARYGGEEFVVLCRQTELANAEILAQRIRATIEQLEIIFKGDRIPVTVSLGVAMIPTPNVADVDSFIANADEALYEAKRSGRNRVVVRRNR